MYRHDPPHKWSETAHTFILLTQLTKSPLSYLKQAICRDGNGTDSICRTSLVAQWLILCAPERGGARVQSLVRELEFTRHSWRPHVPQLRPAQPAQVRNALFKKTKVYVMGWITAPKDVHFLIRGPWICYLTLRDYFCGCDGKRLSGWR